MQHLLVGKRRVGQCLAFRVGNSLVARHFLLPPAIARLFANRGKSFDRAARENPYRSLTPQRKRSGKRAQSGTAICSRNFLCQRCERHLNRHDAGLRNAMPTAGNG
jgi:hypothetical protein